MQEKIAIIDLGTNTFHLLIATIDGSKTKILYREKQAVKIGVGGINQGFITVEAIQRALSTIKNFRTTIDQWKAGHIQALGTSALRSAGNGKDVLRQILQETGIQVKLISGDEEAEYIYLGIRSAMDLGTEKSLIVDIGGGSVEFIIGDSERIYWKQSFEIGAQRLLELYHKHDPILEQEVRLLEAYLNISLISLHEAIQQFAPTSMVGSSGTFDTLSEIYCVRHKIDISLYTGETPLAIKDFYEIHNELLSQDRAGRLRIPGMIEMRADMIVVASCLVKYLLDRYSFHRIRVSPYSLKEGVLAKYAAG